MDPLKIAQPSLFLLAIFSYLYKYFILCHLLQYILNLISNLKLLKDLGQGQLAVKGFSNRMLPRFQEPIFLG